MGMPMARNLAEAGFKVRAWDQNPGRAKSLSAYGAEVCRRPADAARGAVVLITMLSDSAAVLDCAAHAVTSLEPGAIWIQMSTIDVKGIELCQELAAQLNVKLVDAPVLGTEEPAERAELVVLASGPRESLDACEQIFDAIGAETMRFGDTGHGTRAKLLADNAICDC